MKNPFRRKPLTWPTETPIDLTHDWEPLAGYEGIEVQVERRLIVNVRRGEVGNRTRSTYRVPDGVENLTEYIEDRVTEFTQARVDTDA